MMSDNPFRSQMPSQQQSQQQIPAQFAQQSQMPIQGPPSAFSHPPQQILVGGPPQQPQMQNQPPYGMPGMQPQQPIHPPGGPGPGAPLGIPPQSAGGPTAGPGLAPAGAPPSQGQGVDNSYHPISRAKALMVDLKQALQILMKAAADGAKEQAMNDSAPAETSITTVATDTEEIRRALELFDSVCDQIEANFMMLQDLHREQIAGDRYTPANVLLGGQKLDEPPPDAVPGRPFLSYKDYEELVRLQTQFAASVRDSFAECSRLLQ